MQAAPIRVLLVEHEPADAEFVERALAAGIHGQFEVSRIAQLSGAHKLLPASGFDVMLLDLGLPEHGGLEALQGARREHGTIPIVVLTEVKDEQTAILALQQGAQDYLVKGQLNADSLPRSIHFAIQRQQLLAAIVERNLALESRAKLAAIVESSDDAIVSETLDGHIVSWNQGAERMYGYSAEEALGRTIEFLLPMECIDRFREIRSAVQQGKPFCHLDCEFVNKDRNRISISLTMSPIKDVQGLTVGISTIARDISDQKRVEAALRNSQERFELAIHGTDDGLGDWDLRTGAAFWSPRLKEIFGFAAGDDELGDSFSAVVARIHPNDCEQVLRELDQRIKLRQQARCEFRIRTRSGEYHWVEGRGQAVYDAEGRPYRFAGALTDITERKQMEQDLAQRDEQLRQSQRLEALGSLAGGIAHEFNNLLQAIRGYTAFAMDGLCTTDRRYLDLELVLNAANRAATLTRELLSFSRRQMIQRVSVDPREIVNDLANMLRPLIGEQIDFQVRLAEDAGLLIGDHDLIKQMLLNLCINARDAMPSGGQLVLKTQRARLSERYCSLHPTVKPGDYVVFSVADSGCGMTPEIRSRIFEPFFTTKGVGKGTGLGLSMVYGCVQQLNGAINVYSEPGIGTTFKIYLPIAGACPEGNAEVSHLTVSGKETIVIAEDDKLVRDLAVRILTDAGYSVLSARDGAEAVELCDAHADSVSLVLLDAVMPNLTGYQAFALIKSKFPDLPVVFCSGYDPETSQAALLTTKGLPVVQKPFDPDLLLRAIREALDSQPRRAASSRLLLSQ